MTKGLILMILILLTLGPTVVAGHTLVVDYGVESIYIEAYYGGGTITPAQFANVSVSYPDGQMYVEGKTDENGMFSFDPKYGREWLAVVESTGHRGEKKITISAAAAAGEARSETPPYLWIFAGIGYIFGIVCLFLWYKGFRQARQSKDE